MKICENCNLSFDDGKKFCFKCGSPLTTVGQMEAKAKKNPPKSEYILPKLEKSKPEEERDCPPIETNKHVFEQSPKTEFIDKGLEHQSASVALFDQAQNFLRRNQLENAIEKFRILYEEGQQDRIVILYVGIGEALLGDYHHAMMILGSVLNEKNKGLSLIDINRGYLYMAFCLCQTSAGFFEVNKWVSKINDKILDENINVNDEHANVIITEYLVNRCMRNINRPSDAKVQMAELIKTYLTKTNFTANSDSVIAAIWYNIGMKYFKLGLSDEALSAFQEADFLNPDESKYGKKVSEMEKTIVAKSRRRKKKVLTAVIAGTLVLLAAGYLYFHQNLIKAKVFGMEDNTHVVNSNRNIVTDVDGNVYHTVKIGTQVWMVENLKTTKYRNGDPIPYVSDSGEWDSLTAGAYNYYNNDKNLGRIYGCLYNSYAVADSRGLAPKGWHIPSDEEWEVLVNHLGGEDVAGGKLKESGSDHWYNNQDASNSSGFTALPGGCFDSVNSFCQMGYSAHLWTVPNFSDDETEIDFYLINSDGSANRYLQILQMGKSVRCIKDISEW